MKQRRYRFTFLLVASLLLLVLVAGAAVSPLLHDGHLPPFALPLSLDRHHTLVFRNAIDCRRDLAHPSCNAGSATYEFSILYRQDGHVSVLASYRQ